MKKDRINLFIKQNGESDYYFLSTGTKFIDLGNLEQDVAVEGRELAIDITIRFLERYVKQLSKEEIK